jgi:hypothetical protein
LPVVALRVGVLNAWPAALVRPRVEAGFTDPEALMTDGAGVAWCGCAIASRAGEKNISRNGGVVPTFFLSQFLVANY